MKTFGCWTFAAVCILGLASPPAGAQEQCAEIQDTSAAVITPDAYAWKLFVELNKPANLATRCADQNKPFGADGSVVWETWRNVRNSAPDTVFPEKGTDPGEWNATPAVAVRSILDFDEMPLQQVAALALQNLDKKGFDVAFDAAVGQSNETRVNRSAYEFIRNRKFFDRRELIAAAANQQEIVFPAPAKEIKAQWRRIAAGDKGRYHWAEVKNENGELELWGLTALHILTKDTPNWFWATFEHIDNKQAGPNPPNVEREGWVLGSVDKFSCKVAPFDCEKPPTGMGIEGTKWSNYVLRGTQIDFTTPTGRPTLLANSQMERTFQESSCMTCHANATVDANDKSLGLIFQGGGTPNPSSFDDPITGKRRFLQTDFVWSLVARSQPSLP